MSAKINELMKQVDTAAREVVTEIQGIDTRIAGLNVQRQSIGNDPVSREEFLAYIGDVIDQKTKRFESTMKRSLDKISTEFFSIENNLFHSINFLTADPSCPAVITEEACYWYLKPMILERLAVIADDMDFPEVSIPIEKRRAMIAAIDEEISQLRGYRNDLASQLQRAGLLN